ncbi:MAG TPA: clostripain-related cysteine peptidase [Terriglobales bacterium]|jgi:hypothetical protein|nr:clostripain-related cysteine peptidase [Terriglobales bacterium]
METPTPFPIQDKESTHAVIEIFGGDNNLSSFAVEDLQEMAAGNRGPISILALVDYADQGAHVIEQSPRVGQRIVETWGEIDTGDPATLANFFARALLTYPKQRKAIGFWDHGSGVFDENDPEEVLLARALRSVPRNQRSRSVPARRLFVSRAALAATPALRAMLHDDTNGGVLTNYEARGVLNAAFARAGMKSKKVDLIFSDTCLNGMVEVLEQFKDFAEVCVASEDLEPGDGWDYAAWFRLLSERPPTTPADWGKQAVEAYRQGYQSRRTSWPCTLAAFHCENVITQEVGRLVKALEKAGHGGFAAVSEACNDAQSFANRDTFDLADLCTLLAGICKDSEVQLTAKAVAKAVELACVDSVSLGPEVQNATGLAMWVPRSKRSFEQVEPTYQKLEFDKTVGWSAFLANHFYARRARAAA